MKQSILKKLQYLEERYTELAALLSEPDVASNNEKFISLSREYADLADIISNFQKYQQISQTINDTKELLAEDDKEMRDMAQDDLGALEQQLLTTATNINLLLLPKDPNDNCNIFLEIRAGTGGDEASIFAGDLFKMYAKYAELKNWRSEIISESLGEHGGYKEIILRLIGDRVYSNLKFESGAHRVQRVPETESQGRIHTSACTVAVMPEVELVDSIDITPNDLRIDTYRASGAGGQHVNKTDSAVRITHLPSGVVVECQEERSQHKNKAKAMALLSAKILDAQKSKQMAQQSSERRSLVGSGDRSERIRTYNYPQARVTDHRINLTLYKLSEIMEGNLDEIIGTLVREHQADLLASIAN